MDLENGRNNSCVVCQRFKVALRHDIRKLVWDQSRARGCQSWQIKKTLCEKHRHDGFSARGQTVGRPVTHRASPEVDQNIPDPLPTFFDMGIWYNPFNRSTRYGWKLKLRTFFRRNSS